MVGQIASKPKLSPTGLNPAQQTLWVCLDTLLSSNFCENLGMKIHLNIYQDMALKLAKRTDLCFLYPALQGE